MRIPKLTMWLHSSSHRARSRAALPPRGRAPSSLWPTLEVDGSQGQTRVALALKTLFLSVPSFCRSEPCSFELETLIPKEPLSALQKPLASPWSPHPSPTPEPFLREECHLLIQQATVAGVIRSFLFFFLSPHLMLPQTMISRWVGNTL